MPLWRPRCPLFFSTKPPGFVQKKAVLRALTSVMTPAALLLLSACGQTSSTVRRAAPAPRVAASTAPSPASPAPAAQQDTTLSDAQVLERLSRLYRYQSEILTAQSRSDGQAVDGLFELAMADLGRLAREEGIRESTHGARFNEVYRSLVTEYERYYHVSPDDLAVQRGDIFELRAEVFAALNDAASDPELVDVVLPELRPVAEATIPMTRHPLVEASIAFLLRAPERNVQGWMTRAETYFPMIEQIFREEGVPDELKYLAMIESGLNPRAQSRAQAVGMWQFMRPTGAAYGLNVDTYVDERMDPEKATRAAARHLRDLYAQYGNNWHLAIAGYNCSPRCINNGLAQARRAGIQNPTFWDIFQYLPRETRNYVPMFIAAALVVSNADHIAGLESVQPGPRFEYDVVPVRGSLTLSRVAEMAGTTEDVLRALNPSLRRPQLPATAGTFGLRLPVGTGQRFYTAYTGLPAQQTTMAEQGYTVGAGETLTRIARQYGVSEAALRQRNNLPTSEVQPGMRLTIPVVTTAVASAAGTSLQTVRYTASPRTRIASGGAIGRPTTPRPAPATARPAPRTSAPRVATPPAPARPAVTEAPLPAPPVTTVSGGASAEEAARERVRREAEAAREAARERAREEERRAAEERATRERVRREAEAAREAAERSARDAARREAAARATAARAERESERRAAAERAAAERATREAAERTAREAAARETATREAAAPAANTRTVYTVRAGDNLSGVAERHGVTMGQIRQWNRLSSSTVRAGQRLVIYGARPVEAAPATRTTRTPERAAPARREERPTSVTVGRGQTLSEIAREHGVSLANLREWNDLPANGNVRSGQRLRLTAPERPAARTPERAAPARRAEEARPTSHTVRAGDNLTAIARQYGVSVAELRRLNGLTSDNVRAGQRLKVRN